MPVRFHLDENIPPGIAAGLRRRHIDVTTTADARLTGAIDEVQLAFATSERRILVTQDHDFLKLHAAGTAHTGIAYAGQRSVSLGEMLRGLKLIYDLYSTEEMKNRLEFL